MVRKVLHLTISQLWVRIVINTKLFIESLYSVWAFDVGEDPRCSGFFYSCGYNSAGMMFSGGCGEQIADWIINGRPKKHMFNFDIRRYLWHETLY